MVISRNHDNTDYYREKQKENAEYFTYLGSTITNVARCTREITSRIVMPKAALSRKRTPVTSKLIFNLRKK
jgi:hypothetical protein